MADISVGIVLDDKQYTTRLAAAEKSAANLGKKFAEVNTQSQAAFSKMSSAADVVKSKMESLSSVIAGVGLAAFATSAIDSVTGMVDLAAAVGATTESFMELQLAGVSAGQTTESIAGMMAKLNNATNDAFEGNTKLQSSFAALGLSMSEVGRLSPDEKFRQIVVALSEMTDENKRTSLSMELLGRAATKADLAGLAKSFDEFTGTQKEAADAAERADAVMDKLAVTAQQVKNEFVALAAPILEWISPFVGGANQAKIAAEALAGAMALFAGAATISAISAIANGVKGLVGFFTADTVAVAANTVALEVNREAYKFRAAAVGQLGTATKNQIIAETELNAALATGTATKAEIAALENALTVARTKMATATTIAAQTNAAYAGTMQAVAVAETEVAASSTAATGATTALGSAMTGTAAAGSTLLGTLTKIAAVGSLLLWSTDLNEGEDAMVEASKRIGKAMQELTKDELASYYKLTVAQQNLVTNAIQQGKRAQDALKIGLTASPDGTPAKAKATDDRVAVQDTTAIQAAKAQNEMMELSNKLSLEKLQIQKDSIGRSNEQNAIENASFEAQETYLKEELRIRTEVNKLKQQAAQESSSDDTKARLLLQQASVLEEQLALVEQQTSATAKLKIAIAEATDEEKMRLYYLDSERKITDEVTDIRRQANQLTMTQDQIMLDNINKRIDAEVKGAIKIREAQNGGNRISAEEEAGIRAKITPMFDEEIKATQELIDKSRDFSTGWDKAWNEYADNATNAANRARDMFDTLTTAADEAFDKLIGDSDATWSEIVNNAVKNMMRSDFQNALGQLMGQSSGGVSNGFFSGISKFFSGGFANGGFIPAGRYGITGENGPEYVSGPAQITPMQNTSDTYHVTINAVDAKSVQQLLSQHSELIYGLSLKGQRAIGA